MMNLFRCVPSKKTTCFILFFFVVQSSFAQTNTWLQKTSLPAGTRATAFAFSIGDKGYIGGGLNFQTGAFKDFWEYNPASDSWTQRADFGGGKRSGAVAFSIGAKGYALTGCDTDGVKKSDIWEYDPTGNSWVLKNTLPATGRNYSVAFSVGIKGYIGTGYTASSFTSLNDFWQFDPVANSWAQKASVPGPQRSSAVGFGIGGKGYIGTGDTCDYYNCFSLNDFYAYDTLANAWTAVSSAGLALRNDAVAFVIDEKGYICTGDVNSAATNDLIEYDPVTDTWTPRTSKPGLPKSNAFAFSVGYRGYVGAGYDPQFNTTADLYEYTGDSLGEPTTIADVSENVVVNIFPNPSSSNFMITLNDVSGTTIQLNDVSGKILKSIQPKNLRIEISMADLASGIYFVAVLKNGSVVHEEKVVKN